METHIYGKGQCGLLLRLYNMIKWSSESTDLLRTSIHVMRCTFGTIDTIKKKHEKHPWTSVTFSKVAG